MKRELIAAVGSLIIAATACGPSAFSGQVRPTDDPSAAETRIAASIFATQTASAPTATSTPTYTFQADVESVIKNDPRNEGVVVLAYPGQGSDSLNFDLQSVGKNNSPLDVLRVFLQFAQAEDNKTFSEVWLSYRGKLRFTIKGDYFRQLGQEYKQQNPVYTTRTFPSQLVSPDGKAAYPEWTGGLIGVATKQMEDFNDFHHKWYLDDLLKGQ